MQQALRPVAERERIESLDVLRGAGVLGILMVNVVTFAMPGEVASQPTLSPFSFDGASPALWWMMRTLFEGKFLALFSLLFGASLLLVGGDGEVPARGRLLRRRLAWLALFGALHGALIWFADILLHYAIVGLLAAGCRRWPPRRLIAVGAASILVGVAMLTGVELAAAISPSTGAIDAEIARYRAGLAAVQSWNLTLWMFAAPVAMVIYGPITFGMMLLGMALFRLGVLQGRASRSIYVAMLGAGAAALLAIGFAAWTELRDGFPVETAPLQRLPNTLLAPVAMLGYLAGLLLALRTAALRPVVLALAPAGRMAFTNYIAQSLILTAVFYSGRGLGLYGGLDWAQWTLIVLAVWALQLAWSPLWLGRFRMGPLEWLWRRLSYGADLPLKRPPLERAARPTP